MHLGIEGEFGVVVAGSEPADFPTQSERLLLGVVANQITVGLQQARLLSKQKQIANELEQRVAERTASLAAANEKLKKEIEDRKRVEQALRASKINLRQIIDSIAGLVCTMSPDGVTQLVNRPIMDYFGKTFEELRNWTLGDSVHSDDRPGEISAFTQSIATGTPFDSEVRLRRVDGVYRWFHNSGRPVRDTDGIITGWYFLITDIDDRKRAEQVLQSSERDLSLIINTMPVLAWSSRPDGSAEFLNQRWLAITGSRPSPPVSRWRSKHACAASMERIAGFFSGPIRCAMNPAQLFAGMAPTSTSKIESRVKKHCEKARSASV
jgi:PAS domain S-box-containing protein